MSYADAAWAVAFMFGAIGVFALAHEVFTAWNASSQNEDWHP